ncbi:MAG: PEP-CTERM exosortase interaction domain protein, partial [Microcystis sp.]
MTQKILAKLMSFAGSNKLGLFKIAIASSFLVIVPQGQVKAALLTVANNSFETPVITAPSGFNIVSSGTSNNWTFTGGTQQGFANPTIGHNAGNSWYGTSPTLPDGNQVAWS